MNFSENFQAARKITKNYRSVTGYFQSRKNNRPIAFESILERNLFLTLEFDKDVDKYYEQPMKIGLHIDGKKSVYHPDCLIEYKQNLNTPSKIVEVKYTSELNSSNDKLRTKLDAAKQYAQDNGMQFDIFTEERADKIAVENMLFLYSFSNVYLKPEIASKIILLLKNKPMSAKNILEQLSPSRIEQAKILPMAWKMVFDGALKTDFIKQKLSMNSILTGE